MKQSILHALRDLFTGITVLSLSLIIYSLLANDELIYFFITLTFSAFIGGFFLGKLSTFTKRSFLFFTLSFVIIALDEFFKSQNVSVLIPLIALLIISGVGFYCGSTWKSFTLIKKYSHGLAPLLLMSVFFVLMMPFLSSIIHTVHTNVALPEFKLPLINGEQISSESLRGKVTILSFGVLLQSENSASRQTEKVLAKLENVHNRFKANLSTEFYVINVSTEEETKQFAQNHTYPFSYGYDLEGIRHYFRTYTLPALIILDKSGKVRFKSYSYFDEREFDKILAEEIEHLLSE